MGFPTLRLLLALSLLVPSVGLGLVVTAAPVSAGPGQLDAPQVTLNPGGGVLTEGTDGIRFTVNSATGWAGQDAIHYRNTGQYCCSAGAPMLNVGGTLFGQAGPAYDDEVSQDWTSLTVVNTTGSATAGELTSTTGSGSLTVRYVATKDEREYTVDRTVTYTYPNDFVTDSYTFTIPEGNTDQVNFYLGGDTAPGDSDSGYGIMLTSPVRSVISLNPNSQIMFGFREVPGSKTFDGATAQDFYNPYETVQAGGDIGFVVQSEMHDAGLMMQWKLGTTPGTQTAMLRQGVTAQATNLTASFDRDVAERGVPVNLDISIENSLLTATNDLGFTVALPAGTSVASTEATNSCGGTLSAATGGSTVSLSGASVGAAANCVVRVPIVASAPGTYTISAANVSEAVGLENNVGTSSYVVPGPNTIPWSGSTGGVTVVDGEKVTAPVYNGPALVGPLVSVAATATGQGSWGTTADGHVYAEGDAGFHGSLAEYHLNAPIVGIAPTLSGNGYYLVGRDGGIFAFGDATFVGSMGGTKLNQPVSGVISSCSGDGYLMVALDGGVFAFGDATFAGSMGGTALNKGMIGIRPNCEKGGYWTFAQDGGVFTFGASNEFYGSLGGNPPSSGVVSMVPSDDGAGYWLISGAGDIHPFGSAASAN